MKIQKSFNLTLMFLSVISISSFLIGGAPASSVGSGASKTAGRILLRCQQCLDRDKKFYVIWPDPITRAFVQSNAIELTMQENMISVPSSAQQFVIRVQTRTDMMGLSTNPINVEGSRSYKITFTAPYTIAASLIP